MRHVGSSFPYQGLNLGPLHWEHGVLAWTTHGNLYKVMFNGTNIFIWEDGEEGPEQWSQELHQELTLPFQSLGRTFLGATSQMRLATR